MTQNLAFVRQHIVKLRAIALELKRDGVAGPAERLLTEAHDLEMLVAHMDAVHDQDRLYMERSHTASFPAIEEG